MSSIFVTVFSYLMFNLAIWLAVGQGGLLALAGANVGGGLLTLAWFWKDQVKGKSLPNWPVAALGAVGILLIVSGLRGTHASMPVSLGMEAVYNGFAMVSWPLFVALGTIWPKRFTDRPNRFDLSCHFVMAGLVAMRFQTYDGLVLNPSCLVYVAVAIAGYMCFNVSIKLAKGHRATNVTMNLGGAGLVAMLAFVTGDAGYWLPNVQHIGGAVLGCAAIFGIVRGLGAAYQHFGARQQASLVAPLVYDGILVASPSVMLVTGEKISVWTVVLAAGMLAVTWTRYRHNTNTG